MNTMVACDAFTQALTDPLLSKNVYNADTFTQYGLDQVEATPTSQALVDRNVPQGAGIKATFSTPDRARTGADRPVSPAGR